VRVLDSKVNFGLKKISLENFLKTNFQLKYSLNFHIFLLNFLIEQKMKRECIIFFERACKDLKNEA